MIFRAAYLFFAVHEWSVLQIAVSLLCACNSCFSAAAWYTMTNEALLHGKKFLPVFILWGGAIFAPIFFGRETVIICFIAFISMLISFVRLMKVDPYIFYHPVSAKLLSQYHQLCWWFAITPPGSFVFPPKGGLTNRSFLLLVTA